MFQVSIQHIKQLSYSMPIEQEFQNNYLKGDECQSSSLKSENLQKTVQNYKSNVQKGKGEQKPNIFLLLKSISFIFLLILLVMALSIDISSKIKKYRAQSSTIQTSRNQNKISNEFQSNVQLKFQVKEKGNQEQKFFNNNIGIKNSIKLSTNQKLTKNQNIQSQIPSTIQRPNQKSLLLKNTKKTHAFRNPDSQISKDEMKQLLQNFRMNKVQLPKQNIQAQIHQSQYSQDPIRINEVSSSTQNPIKTSNNGKVPRYPKNIFPTHSHGVGSDQILLARQLVNLKNDPNPQSQVTQRQKDYYQQKYRISQYEKELPICVVVPSYNNIQRDRYKNNMNSILQQQYSNYHIVFIDDASTDDTYNKTIQLLTQRKFPRYRVQMIQNKVKRYAMFNLRKAAMEACRPDEIFIIVDGDDELLGRQVFKLYNAFFQNTGAYFVYSNFLMSNQGVGYSRQIPAYVKKSNAYRKYPYVISHLRAFYTKLFQLVDQSDLKDEKNEYYRAANDVAICLPILQMAGQRVQYFPQLTYFYNSATGYNNHMIRLSQQKANDKKVRKKIPYGVILDLFSTQSPVRSPQF